MRPLRHQTGAQYSADWQESDGGANTLGKQLPQPASGDAKILLSASNFNGGIIVI